MREKLIETQEQYLARVNGYVKKHYRLHRYAINEKRRAKYRREQIEKPPTPRRPLLQWELKLIMEMRSRGETFTAIGRELNRNRSTVYLVWERENLKGYSG